MAKISSPDISHKSDVGGVILGLQSESEVQEAFDLLISRAKEKKPSARLNGITLQKQIPQGQEVILGIVRDPQFGPLVMFGAGGIDVEGLKDVAFGLAPLDASRSGENDKQNLGWEKVGGIPRAASRR